MDRIKSKYGFYFRYIIPDYDTRRLNIVSKDYRKFLESHKYVWGNLSATKRFPDFIMNGSDANVKLFIRVYMDAEAHFSVKQGVIQMSSASSEVTLQMYILLKRFSINSRILYKRKCATNTIARTMRDYYEIHISGPALRIYRNLIGFDVDYKKAGLDDVCDNRPINTNTEIIPMLRELVKFRDLTHVSMFMVTNKNNFYGKTNPSVGECHLMLQRLEKLLLIPADVIAWKCDGACYYMNSMRRKYVNEFIKFLKTELLKEVCYIPIRDIAYNRSHDWVYGLKIENGGNYVVEGIICK